jgi:hypothetical protein
MDIYIPRNWEFGSALPKFRNYGGGGVEPAKPPFGTPLAKFGRFRQILAEVLIFLTSRDYFDQSTVVYMTYLVRVSDFTVLQTCCVLVRQCLMKKRSCG